MTQLEFFLLGRVYLLMIVCALLLAFTFAIKWIAVSGNI